jgi:hypothetical protein
MVVSQDCLHDQNAAIMKARNLECALHQLSTFIHQLSNPPGVNAYLETLVGLVIR